MIGPPNVPNGQSYHRNAESFSGSPLDSSYATSIGGINKMGLGATTACSGYQYIQGTMNSIEQHQPT
jgi:hypothetical protein